MSRRVEEKILYQIPLLVFEKKVPLRKIFSFEYIFRGGIPHIRYTHMFLNFLRNITKKFKQLSNI